MTFGFYPQHEYHGPHVGRCPHVGGTALGPLVACANQSEAEQDARQRVLEGERATKTQWLARVAALEAKLAQTKFHSAEAAESEAPAAAVPTPEREPKKRGAPVGHPGWFRPRPEKADRTVTVAAPSACPHCDGAVRVYDQLPAEEHFQEDLSGGRCQTTCVQHPQARCVVRRRWVQQAGEGEWLGGSRGAVLPSSLPLPASRSPFGRAGPRTLPSLLTPCAARRIPPAYRPPVSTGGELNSYR